MPKLAYTARIASSPSSEKAAHGRLAQLTRKPASDVKLEGWRGIMRAVDAAGRVLVTNHDRPQAVILSLREYQLLAEAAERVHRDRESTLEQLTRAFDAELAVLRRPDAGDRLREAFGAPLALHGEVIAGRGY
jgi:prevent-host-death family protein